MSDAVQGSTAVETEQFAYSTSDCAELHVMATHWLRGIHLKMAALPYCPHDPVAEAVLLSRLQQARQLMHDTAELLMLVRH